ncbi:hypothetical protein CEUSTIGMA_g4679.t1 [Chlamydomonas eustigma]|uniref:Uncharacterized protein n=1 Tax=Chlamydomonas eustigma TaxID=1157962 RepID=A0A250X2B7_9CHLO|nr:hypothetical protein CEUSTIGMA_g4679.t1 [Chlamydomonas eustigma]|eukprot:GAX77233.1 hypothetical protein CEUSTIGMA_g4679.t1 [Chlamydomonas eustigma]
MKALNILRHNQAVCRLQSTLRNGLLGDSIMIMDATSTSQLPPGVISTRLPTWLTPRTPPRLPPTFDPPKLHPDILLIEGFSHSHYNHLLSTGLLCPTHRHYHKNISTLQSTCTLHIIESELYQQGITRQLKDECITDDELHNLMPQRMQERLQQFFESTDDLAFFVANGGLNELSQFLPHIVGYLLSSDIFSAPQVIIIQKLTLQISWVIVQASHLNDMPSKNKVHQFLPTTALQPFISAVFKSNILSKGIKCAVARNCTWAIHTICDVTWALLQQNQDLQSTQQLRTLSLNAASASTYHQEQVQVSESSSQSKQCASEHPSLCLTLGLSYGRELMKNQDMAELICGPCLRAELGADASLFSAALLSSLLLLEDIDADLAAAARRALLAPGACLCLCQALSKNREERSTALLSCAVQSLLTRYPQDFLSSLIADHGVHAALKVLPRPLRQMLACHLLTGPGQRAMAVLESEFVVDVPLALAHLIISGHANQVIQATASGVTVDVSGGLSGEVGPQGGSHQHQGPVEDGEVIENHNQEGGTSRSLSTLSLACRLLLSGYRLEELLQIAFEDLEDAEVEDAPPCVFPPDIGSRMMPPDSIVNSVTTVQVASCTSSATGAQAEQSCSQGPATPCAEAAASAVPLKYTSSFNGGASTHSQPASNPDRQLQSALNQESSWVSDVVAATAELMTYLHGLDLKLVKYRARCGRGVSGGVGSSCSGDHSCGLIKLDGSCDSSDILSPTSVVPLSSPSTAAAAANDPPATVVVDAEVLDSSTRAERASGDSGKASAAPALLQVREQFPFQRPGRASLVRCSIASAQDASAASSGDSTRALAENLKQLRSEQMSSLEWVRSWRAQQVLAAKLEGGCTGAAVEMILSGSDALRNGSGPTALLTEAVCVQRASVAKRRRSKKYRRCFSSPAVLSTSCQLLEGGLNRQNEILGQPLPTPCALQKSPSPQPSQPLLGAEIQVMVSASDQKEDSPKSIVSSAHLSVIPPSTIATRWSQQEASMTSFTEASSTSLLLMGRQAWSPGLQHGCGSALLSCTAAEDGKETGIRPIMEAYLVPKSIQGVIADLELEGCDTVNQVVNPRHNEMQAMKGVRFEKVEIEGEVQEEQSIQAMMHASGNQCESTELLGCCSPIDERLDPDSVTITGESQGLFRALRPQGTSAHFLTTQHAPNVPPPMPRALSESYPTPQKMRHHDSPVTSKNEYPDYEGALLEAGVLLTGEALQPLDAELRVDSASMNPEMFPSTTATWMESTTSGPEHTHGFNDDDPPRSVCSRKQSRWPILVQYSKTSFVSLSRAQYQTLRQQSGLLRAWTAAASRQALETVLRVPCFSDVENAVALALLAGAEAPAATVTLQCVNNGCAVNGGCKPGSDGATGQLDIGRRAATSKVRKDENPADPSETLPVLYRPKLNSSKEASLLWRAAHFYQADSVKAQCEDFLIHELRMLSLLKAASSKYDVSSAGPYPPPSCPPASAKPQDFRASLEIILDLCSSYQEGPSDRLLYLLVLWLMPSMYDMLSFRDVCTVLYRHRGVVGPAVMSHLRDQLVTLVMLSDDLVDEVDY